ncbi:cysteine desulfurase family protein [Corynebacterium sp. H113]|uniref:cysteine desulfurase family protein n=1 Tax=Corynebacterium sp. H113 TaxID=3133419 RepID=UPI00403FF4BE
MSITMPARHFLDHAATSPLRPEARDALVRNLHLSNPSGQYATGREAKRVLEESREEVAEILGADPIEVVFTSGGTEADNLAISGLYFMRSGSKIVVPGIEHDAVLKSCQHLEKEHWAELQQVPVNSDGRIDLDQLPELDRRDTALVTCMWANNETGAIQPIEQLAEIASAAHVPLHVDAVQAIGHVPVNFHDSKATTMAMSAHKFGGPRGVGALLVRREAKLVAHNRGGGQERGLRSGTQDVASAAGMAAGLRAAVADLEADAQRTRELRDDLLRAIASIDGALIHTTEPSLPGHIYASFPGAEGDSLIMLFDAAGIDCSTGSACSAGVNRPSHVLLDMGVSESDARSAIRFTLGWTTTQDDIDAVKNVLADTVARARLAGMA